MQGSKSERTALVNPLLWFFFILYIVLLTYTITHHEFWGDELHSWNIAKGSDSFWDLISNRRFEGHPPVWYTILWAISKFTHDVTYIQLAHSITASLVVFLVIFFSPFPFIIRILIPFGYYFLFEYAVLSRNYAIGVLTAFCICLILHKQFKGKLLLYYALLFILSNTHLFALLLACSLHLYFLFLSLEQNKKRNIIALYILLGIIIFLPSVYFISPPSDSQLNAHFWMDKWSPHLLITFGQAPLRSLLPIPAWWNYNFWNTQFLLEAQSNHSILKLPNALIGGLLLALAVLILKSNKKSLILFLTNLFLSFIIAVTVFPMISARYAGFIYIGFITAYWLYCYETPVTRTDKWVSILMLAIQIPGGIFAFIKDIQLPFSNLYKVTELLKEVPANEQAVTDYWALNAVSSYTDKPFYCIDMQKEKSFILWGSDIAQILSNPNRYADGVKTLFEKKGIKQVYMISMAPPQLLHKGNDQLFKLYRVKLIDKREGAIEKGANLYLYRISSL